MELSKLLEPYTYISRLGGKGIRPKLIDAFNYWFQCSPERVETIKEMIQMLHNASLMIDDIQDNSNSRRGQPATHKVFGAPLVINCGCLVYWRAMALCRQMDSNEALGIFIDEMNLLHEGQGLDILWRDNYLCPTEEQYTDMVLKKTGGLFRMASSLLRVFGQNPTSVDATELIRDLSIYFQILDDYQNLKSSTYHRNKSFCEDITEGKFSFPIIHCIRVDSTDTRLFNVLKQRTQDEEVKRYALTILEEKGSFEYTQQRLAGLRGSIDQAIEKLGGNMLLQEILTSLTSQTTT